MTWLYHSDFIGTLAAPLAGIKRLIWNVRCSELQLEDYRPFTRWTVALLARMSRYPWAVCTNSHAGRASHEAIGYEPKRWIYLPNGVDTQLWHPDPVDRREVRQELGLAPHDTIVALVARVDPLKDHANFLAAAELLQARCKEVKFVLVGRGTRELTLPVALQRSIKCLGERPDVPRLLRAFDIAVLSSKPGEGFPNVVAESMATGLPCVVTNVGDAAELVGSTGVVVSHGDPAALSSGIETLIAEPPEAHQLRRERVRDRVTSDWSIEATVGAYRKTWAHALAEPLV
jgi:glycosyltransferase involved in cell wall biosynthesis